jgi:hypothetical protein
MGTIRNIIIGDLLASGIGGVYSAKLTESIERVIYPGDAPYKVIEKGLPYAIESKTVMEVLNQAEPKIIQHFYPLNAILNWGAHTGIIAGVSLTVVLAASGVYKLVKWYRKSRYPQRPALTAFKKKL